MEETMKSTYTKRNGHERYKIIHKTQRGLSLARRKRALERAQQQLEQGGYTLPEGIFVELSDKRRIKLIAEIEILKQRT